MFRYELRLSLGAFTAAIGLTSMATVLILGTVVTSQGRPDREYINLTTRSAQAAYSDAVLAGNMLYVAARIGTDPKTNKVPDDVELETKFVLDSIKAVIEKAGLTMDDVINVQVFCPDPPTYSGKFNAVYRKYFGEHVPARAFTGSGPLLGGGHFQVQAIAMKR